MKRRPLLLAPTMGLLARPAMAAAAPPATTRRVLRVALATPETTLDPVQSQSDNITSILLAQMLEAPLCYDYLARPARLLPCTAVALPEVSADHRVFTLRIRPGILFHDHPVSAGKPRELVAQDYVYSFKRFFDPRWNASDLYLFEGLQIPGMAALRERALKTRQPFDYDTEVPGLRALDRYTLRITLGISDPRFVYLLAAPQNMGAVAREVVEHHGDAVGDHPIGTGAFRLKSWRRASRIVLERHPAYRPMVYEGQPADQPQAREAAAALQGRRLPLADEVVADVIEEDQPRWLSFLNGTYAWMQVPGSYRPQVAPGGQLAPYLAKRGVRLHLHAQADMTMNFFYMEDPIVGGYTPDKVALRRAIGLAFDGPALRQQVMGGFGVPAQSTIAPQTSGYDPDYRSDMSLHDPARAQALLDTYGYVDRDGDGWRELPNGQPLVLRMAGLADQTSRRLNEIWSRSMRRVGLNMQFEIATWPELLKRTRAGSLMMWGYSWSATSPDGGFFLGIAYGPNAAEANDPRFSLPAFDRLFERQREMPDGPEREAVMRQAKDLLVAYMPYKVHLHNIYLDVLQPATRGYWRHPFMRDIWRFVDPGPA